jgi:DNA-binding response OmpR family regulator
VETIVIIDDDLEFAKHFAMRLEKRGLNVLVHEYSDDVLELFEGEGAFVVLLDIIMPKVDGYEVLKRIRKRYNQSELPVIMLTIKDQEESIVEALKLGANDYLTKPANVNVALARIKTQFDTCHLNKELLEKEELEAIKAIVTTINHEVNNALALAIGYLNLVPEDEGGNRVKCGTSLQRIKDIVCNLENITDSIPEKEKYAGDLKIYKLN